MRPTGGGSTFQRCRWGFQRVPCGSFGRDVRRKQVNQLGAERGAQCVV